MNEEKKYLSVNPTSKLLCQGRSHQNLSGQVEIISQASTYSDFQINVIVVHSMHSIYYRGIGTGPANPATAGPKFPVATSRDPTINNKR